MLPSIFGEDLFDEFFGRDFWNMQAPLYGRRARNIMKADVRETEGSYELDVDLPGFKKDEVNVSLENGYLTISAQKGIDKRGENEKGRYIRQERYVGQCSRSFYVGTEVQESDIHARFEDGILRLSIPKKEEKQLPGRRVIAIE